MFPAVLRAERYKLRRSPVWLAFLLLPVFPAFFGSVNFLGNQGLLSMSWESLWTQHSLFSSYFFLPALIGVYCSYLWRLEHFDHNWNQVLAAPVPLAEVFLGKLWLAAAMSLVSQAWAMLLFFIAGLLCGLPAAAFPHAAAMWLVCGVCGATAICSLQLVLSLVIRSFAVPVGIAMAGGIAGLAATSKGFGYFFPYSLLHIGLSANHPDETPHYPLFFASCAVFLLLFSAVGVLYLRKRDVRTG